MIRTPILSAALLLLAAACSDAPQIADATIGDAGPLDAHPDAASPDAGAQDTGNPDAGAEDTGISPTDAAMEDAAMADAGPSDAGTSTPSWARPRCAAVSGSSAVTFTFDEGRTLAGIPAPLTGTVYTYGLVALDTPNTLLAVHGSDVLTSTDAGCSWRSIGTVVADFPPTLVAARGGRAYGYSDNRDTLFRIDGTTITLLTSPTTNIKGLAVDPQNPDRIRIATDNGVVMESTTAGVGRFQTIGVEPFPGNGLVYQLSFDPRDLDHVVAGAASEGAKVSFDGGRNWTAASVRTTTQTADRGTNIFSLKFSPVSGDVVWIEGIDLGENLANYPSEGRHIWRSVDGGRSFQAVVEKDATVSLTNGVLMAPHPREPNILYFEFGTYFGGYGTDIFRYDASSRSLSLTHNAYDDVGAIAFMPGDPAVMYFGLVNEEVH
ncbi:MAG: dispase autolysis-inducing protein [Myxococcota bacterium]